MGLDIVDVKRLMAGWCGYLAQNAAHRNPKMTRNYFPIFVPNGTRIRLSGAAKQRCSYGRQTVVSGIHPPSGDGSYDIYCSDVPKHRPMNNCRDFRLSRTR